MPVTLAAYNRILEFSINPESPFFFNVNHRKHYFSDRYKQTFNLQKFISKFPGHNCRNVKLLQIWLAKKIVEKMGKKQQPILILLHAYGLNADLWAIKIPVFLSHEFFVEGISR